MGLKHEPDNRAFVAGIHVGHDPTVAGGWVYIVTNQANGTLAARIAMLPLGFVR